MTIPRELALTNYKSELVLTQKPVCVPTHQLEVNVRKNKITGWTGFSTIGYNAELKQIFVDGYTAPYEPQAESFNLHLLLDRSSIELFTGDGIRSISLSNFLPLDTPRELTPFTD